MLFSANGKSKLDLLIEIQSSMVRCSLVLFKRDRTPELIYSQEINIDYKPNATSAYYVRSAMRDLKEVIEITLRKLHAIFNDFHGSAIPKRIDEIHFILSSPWIVSQTRTIGFSFDKETVITMRRVHGMLTDEREKMSFDHRIKVETVEEKIFEVRLNGYPITNWQNREADKVEISYALSVGSTGSIADFRELVTHATGCKTVSFNSALILQYLYLRDIESTPYPYAIIYVHDELTDIMVAKRQTCSFFGSFPIGINTVIRKISEATNVDYKSAGSLFSLYIGNHLNDEQKLKLDGITKNVVDHWAGGLRKLFGAKDGGDMPENIFVIAKAHESFFSNSLRSMRPGVNIKTLPEKLTSMYAHAIHNAK